jgi:hypothetical protein
LGILAVIGIIWGLPQARPLAIAAGAQAMVVAQAPSANSGHLIAAAPLPIAGSVAFELLPVPPAQRPGHHVAPPKHPVPAAASASPSNGWGSDISWPQCDGAYPGAHDLGVVGITGGRPFTSNPCLGSQWGWAKASRFVGGAQAYLNLEIDGTSLGPNHCGADDHVCRAYDYGYLSAVDTMGRAGAEGVHPDFWWLDVEVGNNWSDLHPDWNVRTVQGAIDALTQRGYSVGIYSSIDQWAQIVPDGYRPGVPTWLAVVGDAASAGSLCSPGHSLTGGPVLMVQYDDHGFDSDYICGTGVRAFAAAGARTHR